jgi:hypothetical protein
MIRYGGLTALSMVLDRPRNSSQSVEMNKASLP